MTTDMLDTARRYVACGLSVIPIRRWSKLPDHQLLEGTTGQTINYAASDPRAAWRRYTEQTATDAELVRWFDGTDAGLGIVGGAVSGGLVRLDFEHPACLATWYSLLSEDRSLFAGVSLLPVVKTGKGHHVYFRMENPPGHEVLCASGEGDKLIVFSETQGEGCYCVAPPTRHYNDQVVEFGYQWVSGGPVAIPTLEGEIARTLIDAARFPGFWAPTFAAPWGGARGHDQPARAVPGHGQRRPVAVSRLAACDRPQGLPRSLRGAAQGGGDRAAAAAELLRRWRRWRR